MRSDEYIYCLRITRRCMNLIRKSPQICVDIPTFHYQLTDWIKMYQVKKNFRREVYQMVHQNIFKKPMPQQLLELFNDTFPNIN
jgi:hypothetical protein